MKTTLLIVSLCAFLMSCNSGNGSYRPGTSSEDRYSKDDNQDSDWQITSRVKAVIMADTSLSASGRTVGVETNNGVVTLTGSVPSREESYAIERKTKSVSGVRKVDNRLTINP